MIGDLFKKKDPIKVSLSTHTVYPAIIADDKGRVVARFHKRDGTVVLKFKGSYQTRELAIAAAIAWVQKEHSTYLL